MARVCLAGGQNKNRVKPFKYCAKWIFMGLYAIDVVMVFGSREESVLSEIRHSPWLGAERTPATRKLLFYDSLRLIQNNKRNNQSINQSICEVPTVANDSRPPLNPICRR